MRRWKNFETEKYYTCRGKAYVEGKFFLSTSNPKFPKIFY